MRYLLKGIITLVFLCLLAIGTLYVWSSMILTRTYDAPLTKLDIPTDSAAITEGARLIRIAHCRDCHGEQFNGRIFHVLKDTAQYVGPNLTSVVSTYSDEELERVIRHGVKKNGTSVFVMPSNMYYELKDDAVAKIIAYMRTLTPVPTTPDLPESIVYYPMGRLQLILGNIPPRVTLIDHNAARQYNDQDTSKLAFGKYLTMTTCSGCHGMDLKGVGKRPNLVIASAYSKDQFHHLIKTGEGALGRKELGLMTVMAKGHLRYMNDVEIDAMYTFLKTLPYRKD